VWLRFRCDFRPVSEFVGQERPLRGRHRGSPARPRLRWLAALAGGSLIGAVVLALSTGTANASDSVTATFAVTGVSASNCAVSAGGSDVYVKPGQELDVKSSLAGIVVQGNGALSDLLGKVASFDGALTIDPKSADPTRLDISTKVQKVTGLARGNHTFTWKVDKVELLGLLGSKISLPLQLSSRAAAAGGSLNYSGTIHVTPDAAQCGIAVQVPGVSASASVTGLPPIKVGVPGRTLSLPATVPNVNSPSGGGGPAGHPKPGASASGATLGNVIPVPVQVVPSGDNSQVFGNPGFGSGGGSGLGAGNGTPAQGAGSRDASASPAAVPQLRSTGKHKTIDLASNKASTGQLSIVLAIVAVVALALVAGTYARLYLLRKE
jgi:hypothetical protein